MTSVPLSNILSFCTLRYICKLHPSIACKLSRPRWGEHSPSLKFYLVMPPNSVPRWGGILVWPVHLSLHPPIHASTSIHMYLHPSIACKLRSKVKTEMRLAQPQSQIQPCYASKFCATLRRHTGLACSFVSSSIHSCIYHLAVDNSNIYYSATGHIFH